MYSKTERMLTLQILIYKLFFLKVVYVLWVCVLMYVCVCYLLHLRSKRKSHCQPMAGLYFLCKKTKQNKKHKCVANRLLSCKYVQSNTMVYIFMYKQILHKFQI